MSEEIDNDLRTVGFKWTKVYLIALAAIIPALGVLGAIDIKPMGINELGDFLAGVFGPLALIWVVLGFLQQGHELKASSDALNLQAEELKNSVKAQSELSEATQKQLELQQTAFDQQTEVLMENSKSNFQLIAVNSTPLGGTASKPVLLDLVNIGNTAVEISFDPDQYKKCDFTAANALNLQTNKPAIGNTYGFAFWEKYQSVRFSYTPMNATKVPWTEDFTIYYKETDGTPRIVNFKIQQKSSKKESHHEINISGPTIC